jgi:hypothetical protein
MSSPRSSPTAASIAAMSQPTGQPSPTERRPTGESAVDEDQRPGGRDGSGPAGSRWEQLLDEPGAAWTSAAAMRLSGCGAAQANFRPAGRPRMRVKPGSPASPRPPSARPTPPRPPTSAPVAGRAVPIGRSACPWLWRPASVAAERANPCLGACCQVVGAPLVARTTQALHVKPEPARGSMDAPRLARNCSTDCPPRDSSAARKCACRFFGRNAQESAGSARRHNEKGPGAHRRRCATHKEKSVF